MINKYLFGIIFGVFIDLLGFSLIIPLLPYYAQTFNASDTTVGLLLASYAAAQLIGVPLRGRRESKYKAIQKSRSSIERKREPYEPINCQKRKFGHDGK